jgi:serine/threonine-protein kinase RsbW
MMPRDDATFHCNATSLDVRGVLSELRAHLETRNIREDDCSNIELALAEALNNIVEHAYALALPGTITLLLRIGEGQLTCELRDSGRAMPSLVPPDATGPDVTPTLAALPEGGFGWSLIHALTVHLHFIRDGSENRLVLDFDLGASESARDISPRRRASDT